MTEREKMIEIVLDTEITGIKLRNITGGMSTANAIADALIAANIGDVTEWKERAEKEKTEKNKWKCTANDWRQRFESAEKKLIEFKITSCEAHQKKDKVCREQKAEIARLTAEVAELLDCPNIEEGAMTEEVEAWKARVKELEEEYNELQNALVKLCNQVAKTAVATGSVAINKATLEFFPCKSDWSGSCKKCYFASGNYPHDTCRCENNQHHWVSADAPIAAGAQKKLAEER